MFTGNEISNIISGQSAQMSAAFQNSVNLASFAEGGQQVPASSPPQIPSMPVTLSAAPFPEPQFQTMASRAGARYFGSAGTYSPMFSPMQVQEMVEREDARRRETWMVGGITNFAAPVAAMGAEFAVGGALGSALYQRSLQRGLAAAVQGPGMQFAGKQGLRGIASSFGAGTAARMAPGALAAGAVGWGLPMAALAIVYSGAEHVWEMHQQNRMAEDILGGNEWRLGNIEGPSNRGAQIAGGMRRFAGQTKAGGGMKMNVDELMEMLQFGVEAGMFDMNRSFSDLERKMTQAFEASRTIARVLKTTVQGGMQMLGELQQMGFYDTSAAAQQAYNITGMAGAAGMAPGQMFGMMGMGAQMARGMGLRGAAGATAAGGITTALRVGMREGLVGAGTIGELGGIGAATQTVLGASAGFAQGPIGMGMMAAFGRGGFDTGAFNRFAGGRMGLGEMMSGMGGLSRGEAVGLASPFSQQRMGEQIMQRGPEAIVAFGAQLLERNRLDVNMDNLATAVSNLAPGMDANQLRAVIESGISAPRGRKEAAVETAMQRVRVEQAERAATTARPWSLLAGYRRAGAAFRDWGYAGDVVGAPILEGARSISERWGMRKQELAVTMGHAIGREFEAGFDLIGVERYKNMTEEQMTNILGDKPVTMENALTRLKEDIVGGAPVGKRDPDRVAALLQDKGDAGKEFRGMIAAIAKSGKDYSEPMRRLLIKEGKVSKVGANLIAKRFNKQVAGDTMRSLDFTAAATYSTIDQKSFEQSIGMSAGESYEIAGVSLDPAKGGLIPTALLRALKEGPEAVAEEFAAMTTAEATALAKGVGDTAVGKMFTSVAAEMGRIKETGEPITGKKLRGAVTSGVETRGEVSPYEGAVGWGGGVAKQDTMNVRTIYVGKIEKGIVKE